MATKSEITHSGKIVDITPECTTVEIISESACSSCHAKGLCGLSDSVRKTVNVPTTLGNWYPGQDVDVVLKRSMGFKAVWVAYVLPLFVLLAVLLTLVEAGLGELLSGLIGLASVAVYYFGVFLFRNKLRNQYSFYIKEK